MAAATAKKAPKLFTVKFEPMFDGACDSEPFNVLAPDGEHERGFETREEAVAYRDDCNAGLLADAESEEEAEREELVAAIQARVEEMNLAELRKLAKRLKI